MLYTNVNIPPRVLRDIERFAEETGVEKIILFGSRARGTNTERSDIDIAVSGGDFDDFYWKVNEETWSLLSFDIVDLSQKISDELREEIRRDGKVLYEKDR